MLIGMNITIPKRKRALLLLQVQRLTGYLILGQILATTVIMPRQLKSSLQKNIAYEGYNFRQTKQKDGESLDNYHTRICQLARTCEFSIIDKEIKEHIILTFSSCSLRRRALRENLTLEALLKLGRALELSEKQASQVETETAGVNATETKGSIDVVAYASETLLTATSYNRQNPTKRTRDACGKVGHF